jgi:hypothetical protein
LEAEGADDTTTIQSAEVFLDAEDVGDVQPSADNYGNDLVGTSVFLTSPVDPGYVNSTDNTLVLGDSSEMNEESSNLKLTKSRNEYAADLFPSNATFNQICSIEIHHS